MEALQEHGRLGLGLYGFGFSFNVGAHVLLGFKANFAS